MPLVVHTHFQVPHVRQLWLVQHLGCVLGLQSPGHLMVVNEITPTILQGYQRSVQIAELYQMGRGWLVFLFLETLRYRRLAGGRWVFCSLAQRRNCLIKLTLLKRGDLF